MAAAGQEEERPGEESEGIHYFDFSDPFGPAGDEADADPFESEGPAGHGPDAAAKPSRPKPESSTREEHAISARDAFEFALTDLSGSTPPAANASASRADAGASEVSGAPSEVSGAPSEESGVTFSSLASVVETKARAADRRQFAAAFDAACADPERPFLAVALRMPVSSPTAARFPLVVQGIRSALPPGGALLADSERRRLVAVLPGRGADATRPLFTHLMAYLRDHAPDAEEVGRAIEVLAAPHGRPFQRAADFLAATFDEP